MTTTIRSSIALTIAAVAAILFGGLTIYSGGQALFGSPDVRAAVGNAVPFVLGFNFAMGFAYVLAGVGLLARRKWASWLSGAIAASTILVFAAFLVVVLQGGAYEMRTVGAMILRSAFWIGVFCLSLRASNASTQQPAG